MGLMIGIIGAGLFTPTDEHAPSAMNTTVVLNSKRTSGAIPADRIARYSFAAAVAPFEFDAIYGAWWRHVILSSAKERVAKSVERYLRAIA